MEQKLSDTLIGIIHNLFKIVRPTKNGRPQHMTAFLQRIRDTQIKQIHAKAISLFQDTQ
jgi:hypothetical protein